MRTEFGLTRVVCDCKVCSRWCKAVPGYLVPSDLGRLIPADTDPYQWADEHLRASIGLKFGDIWIPSLVPAKQENGHCHWFINNRCAVHENAPFGCAFFSDCKHSPAEADQISAIGRAARGEAFQSDTLYARIWRYLWDKGLQYLTCNDDKQKVQLGYDRLQRFAAQRHARAKKKAQRKRK